MQRIFLILLLFVLLLNGRHPVLRAPQKPETMTLIAKPLPLGGGGGAPWQPDSLRYLGGWSLTASHPGFGGISSMRVADDGAVTALSDAGEVFTFRIGQSPSVAHMRLLPILRSERRAPRYWWDTESQAWDPAGDRIWVGFEGRSRICRYSVGFGRVEQCHAPDAILGWKRNAGMESLARLPDGRFIAIAENSPGPDGEGHDMLLFGGDPVDRATPPPLRIGYRSPQGYLPTDALAVGPHRLLILHRRFTLADGFTGLVTLVDLRDRRPGRLLRGRIVARLTAPMPHDNFEAIAMNWQWRGGQRQPMLWIASDDNHLVFQRTLLLKFALPPALFADGGGGIPDKDRESIVRKSGNRFTAQNDATTKNWSARPASD